MSKSQEIENVRELEIALARVQERFATLESAAEGCCSGALQASELAGKVEASGVAPALRSRVEQLQTSARRLKEFEQTLRTQVMELRKPIAQLETSGLRRR